MGLFLEGLGFGLLLAISLGPIFVVTVHSAIEKGRKAGFSVTSGVWVSDILYIVFSFLFISRIDHIVKGKQFDFWMSIIGGIILILFGLFTFFKKSKFDKSKLYSKTSLKSIGAYFTKGFLVNTVNPFTVIFWLGMMSSIVIGRDLTPSQSFSFISAILIVIVLSDSIKVLLAVVIREVINQYYFNLISKIAGTGLFIFGAYLIYHGLVN